MRGGFPDSTHGLSFSPSAQEDAAGSRLEPGCLRFDFLEVSDAPNSYVFYEVYKDAASVAFHKEQAHYQKYAAFKDSGGILSRDLVTTAAIDFQR